MDETRITYLPDGTKTGVAGWNGTGVKYCGSFVYEKASPDSSYKLSSVLWDEGVISCGADSTSLAGALFVRDHLGSVRSVVNLSAPASATIWDAILETRDYLPLGTEAVDTSDITYKTWAQNRWRYEGKETLPYTPAPTAVKDFGARYYDSYTASWLSADPKSWDYTSMSPYAFCAGDPEGIVDPDGRDIWQMNEHGYILSTISTDDFDAIQYVSAHRFRKYPRKNERPNEIEVAVVKGE